MTMNWKRTGTANGAGAEAPHAAMCVSAVPSGRIVRALRWKQDAVCRYASADEELRAAEPGFSSVDHADSASSSLTRTIFFSSRIQTKTQTRKETNYNTQEKKGKQSENQVTISQKLETLA